MPSIHTISTGVTVCRPTSSSLIRRSGVRTRRRNREVLVRTDSTKESLGPLSGGSFSGSEMDRFSSVPTLKERTSFSPGKKRMQFPPIISNTASSIVARFSTPKL